MKQIIASVFFDILSFTCWPTKDLRFKDLRYKKRSYIFQKIFFIG